MFKNREQKKHFKSKITNTQKKIWDIIFLRDQYKLTREGFRAEYDRLKELEDAANVRIEAENVKPDPDKTIIEQLSKLKERYEPDMLQLKKQMSQMDLIIEGPAPEGSQQRPINEQIDGLKQVIQLLKDKVAQL